MGTYIEDEDDYYYEQGEDYEYYEDEDGYQYREIDDDGDEYVEAQSYGGGSGCMLLLMSAGGVSGLVTALQASPGLS